MNNLAHKVDSYIDTFKSELREMIDAAKSPEERIALKAFAQAMGPYFDRPERLRSSLGKIQMEIMGDGVQRSIAAREFASLDEIKELLPSDVNVRLEQG